MARTKSKGGRCLKCGYAITANGKRRISKQQGICSCCYIKPVEKVSSETISYREEYKRRLRMQYGLPALQNKNAKRNTSF